MTEIQNTEGEQNTDQELNEYQERRKLFLDDLLHKLDEENVTTAIITIIDPKLPEPIVYGRGQTYNLTKIACDIAKHLKSRLDSELTI